MINLFFESSSDSTVTNAVRNSIYNLSKLVFPNRFRITTSSKVRRFDFIKLYMLKLIAKKMLIEYYYNSNNENEQSIKFVSASALYKIK